MESADRPSCDVLSGLGSLVFEGAFDELHELIKINAVTQNVAFPSISMEKDLQDSANHGRKLVDDCASGLSASIGVAMDWVVMEQKNREGFPAIKQKLIRTDCYFRKLELPMAAVAGKTNYVVNRIEVENDTIMKDEDDGLEIKYENIVSPHSTTDDYNANNDVFADDLVVEKSESGLDDEEDEAAEEESDEDSYAHDDSRITTKKEFPRKRKYGGAQPGGWKCTMCDAVFRTLLLMYAHRKTHPKIPRTKSIYQCDICQKTFNFSGNMLKHKRIHLEDEEQRKPFKCEVCGRRFTVMHSLKSHQKQHLPAEMRNSLERFTCEICGVSSTNKWNFKKHMQIHLVDDQIRRALACEVCGRRFAQKDDLRKHKRVHLDDADPAKKEFECDVCGKHFAVKNSLEAHKRTHLENVEDRMPFKCEECPKRFGWKEALARHKVHHLKNDDPLKMFTCETCGHVLNSSYGLFVHKKSHFDDVERRLPFECKVCNRRFAESCKLKKHSVTHLPDEDPLRRRYHCDICGGKFACPKSFKTHKERHLGHFPFKFPCAICKLGHKTKKGATICRGSHKKDSTSKRIQTASANAFFGSSKRAQQSGAEEANVDQKEESKCDVADSSEYKEELEEEGDFLFSGDAGLPAMKEEENKNYSEKKRFSQTFDNQGRRF